MRIFKKVLFIAASCSLLFFISCDLLEEASSALTEAEVTEGLKEALGIGLDNSVLSASSADGYLKNEVIKILLPSEVLELQSKIETEMIAGFVPLKTVYTAYIALENNGNDLFDELAVAMNRGAEKAADKALPIFGNAITSMSISDAFGILNGDETAATEFFYQTTNQSLFEAFNPDVKSALDDTGANQLFTKTAAFLNFDYNVGIGTVSPSDVLNVNLPNSIDEYATNKAIDGLFHLVGEEEKKIREDPFAWGSSIIEKVFGSVSN